MTVGNPEESRLMTLAGSIDEDDEIDWEAAERAATSEDERAAVRELRMVANIVRICRDPDRAVPPLASAPSPDQEARLGQWGPYSLLERVGRGAFGSVYRAVDKLEREVALKLLVAGADGAAADAARVLREGRLLARISHANVITVYAADEFDGRVGLSMQFIEGFTLEDELHARGTLGSGEATLIGVELCRALAAVHAAGLLHRDVKAQNVMREVGGRIILMDLGAGHEATPVPPTSNTHMAGTPLYLAPEIYAGRPASAQSDIYSAGVLLFHLVTGAFPVEGASIDALRAAHERRLRRRLRDLRPDLPSAFVQAVERALDPQPERRYRTAGEFEAALTSLLPTPPSPLPAADRQPVRSIALLRNRWLLTGGSLVGALSLGLTIWLLIKSDARHESLVEAVGAGAPVARDAAASASVPGYTIDASFWRVENGVEWPLVGGSRVKPGDELSLSLEASRDVFVYVINEDAAGEAYLLFPLRGQSATNPLPAGRRHRLPGVVDGQAVNWRITSAGGEEHFLLFVSPRRLTSVETMLASLPAPTFDRPVDYASVPPALVGELRGVGGLVAAQQAASAGRKDRLSQIVQTLAGGTEVADGVWVRQLVLQNPSRPAR